MMTPLLSGAFSIFREVSRLAQDAGKGMDGVSVGMNGVVVEGANHNTHWKLEKYGAGKTVDVDAPDEVVECDGNILVNAGINLLWTLACGGAGTAFSNANAYLGVGDSSTAADAAQTDLQATTNKLRKAMDASYPTYGASQKATFRSTFGSGDANFAWNEVGVFNASSGGTMLNRKVQSLGTKASGTTWVLTVEITLS